MKSKQSVEERVQRELHAHTENDVLAESRRLKNRFAHILNYPSRKRYSAIMESFLQELSGKRILDYGCARGEASMVYLERGAIVDGIDISPVYIEDAKHKAVYAGYPKIRYAFHVMDAHSLNFDDNTFDLVVGNAILHHLDAEIALNEIYRVLKPKGRLLMHEPLADNPLLKIFRWLTPSARTKDEAPFTNKDLKKLTRQNRWITELAYCGLLEAPVAMLTSKLIPQNPENFLLKWADAVERYTLDHGILLSWNQYVLFNMVKLEI